MKTEFLVSLIAILAVLTLIHTTSVLAASTGDLNASINEVTLNGVSLDGKTLVDYSGNTAIVKVEYTVNSDYSNVDASVRVWIGGKDTQASVKEIVLTEGTHYEYVSLQLPTDVDSIEDLALYVRIEAGANYLEDSYNLNVQRHTYNVDIFNVDSDKTVKAGDTLPVTVVLTNEGFRELKNMLVSVSIPELGVTKTAYFNDLVSNDSNTNDNSNQDSAERSIGLKIPSNAKAGVYEMKIEAFNSHVDSIVTKNIVVVGSEDESKIVIPITSKDVNAGETATYDIVIVNSGSKIGIFEVVPETTSGATVSVDKPVVTIPAGSSATVQVSFSASREGTYNFAVGVNSEDKPVQRVVFNANVSGKAFSGNVALITIILAIVFVVLLVVLIVLLTRKPMKSEELEESYY